MASTVYETEISVGALVFLGFVYTQSVTERPTKAPNFGVHQITNSLIFFSILSQFQVVKLTISYKLLLLGHRSLIKKIIQTAVINVF